MMTNDSLKKDVPHTSYYESTYMAEALDAALDIEVDGFDDGTLYWDMFRELLRQNRALDPHPDHTIVLDVGAGSGRIFRKIAQRAAKAGEDLTDASFIGLDKSPTMLERAKKRGAELASVGRVSWLEGDASDLLAQPSLCQARQQVSLALCADGGIGYLERDADINSFFSHISQLLCPGSGRAHISLLEFQVAEAYENGKVPTTYDESMECMDGIGKEQPLVFKNIHHHEYVENGIHIGKMDTEVIQRDKQGKETLLEIVHYRHRFRVWSAEELIQTAEKAGLKHVETIKWPRMRHYVFMSS
ncbi:hypothetical protein MauCBS54593_004432 [Microsporum audouinii]